MKNQIAEMLTNVLGEDAAKEVFNNNILSHSLTGYKKGKILTFGELKMLPNGTILNIVYKDEYSNKSSTFDKLYKGEPGEESTKEWCVGGSYPFPIDELKDDTLIKDIPNCDEFFTIYEAIDFN